jgi:hypothetical protein
MKIKLWQWEYDFDKEDAKIVVPLVLLMLGLAFTQLNKEALWSGVVAYYLLYFFLKPSLVALKDLFAPVRQWLFLRSFCRAIRGTIPMNSMLSIFVTAAGRRRSW